MARAVREDPLSLLQERRCVRAETRGPALNAEILRLLKSHQVGIPLTQVDPISSLVLRCARWKSAVDLLTHKPAACPPPISCGLPYAKNRASRHRFATGSCMRARG